MRAIVQRAYGEPSVLDLETVEDPTVGPGQLLVAVHRTAVSRAGVALSRGRPFVTRLYAGLWRPSQPVPGMSVAGVVVAVGAGVERFAVGDRVYGATLDGGGLAERALLAADGLVRRLPDALSWDDAIGVMEAHTAWYFLRHVADVQPGWRVLVNGASGAVGSTAVQLARHLGAHVVGVCSTANAAFVLDAGAHRVIDRTTHDFTADGERFDLVLDAVGLSSFGACRGILRPEGRYLTTQVTLPGLLWPLWTRLAGGPQAGVAFAGLNQSTEHFAVLERLIAEGALRTHVDRTWPLAETPDAFRYVASGRKRGVVTVAVA